MNLRQFLIEQDDIERRLRQAIQQIVVDCSPYLRAIGVYEVDSTSEIKETIDDSLLFRGISKDGGLHVHRQVRTDRLPTDTPKPVHQFINQWFKQHFGVPARSTGLFTSASKGQVIDYGTPYYIFPVGQYEMISSPHVIDLYEHLTGSFREELGDSMGYYVRNAGFGERARGVVSRALKNAEFQYYNPREIKKHVNGEVIILCDSYHAILHSAIIGNPEKFAQMLLEETQGGTR